MNWLRNLLILAIATVVWILIHEWQTESQTIKDLSLQLAQTQSSSIGDFPKVQDENVKPVDDNSTVQVTNDTTDNPKETSTSSSSLPAFENAPSQAQLNASVSSENLITVETDVFTAQIRPLGGDLVSVGLKEYPVSLSAQDIPFKVLRKPAPDQVDGLYFAESGIVGKTGSDLDSGSRNSRPTYSFSKTSFTFEDKNQKVLSVPLIYTNAKGIQFEKIYHFPRKGYDISVEYKITNPTDQSWMGIPFNRLRRSGFTDPSSNQMSFGMSTYLGGAYVDPEEKFKKIDFDDMSSAFEQNTPALNQTMQGGWVAMLQHYFLTAWIPPAQLTHQYRAFEEPGTANTGPNYVMEIVSPTITTEAKSTQTYSAKLYVGPKIQDWLKELAPGLHLTVDYGFLFFISDALIFVLDFIHKWVKNWGWSIVLLTLFVRACLWPLSAKSYKSMAQMRKLQPKLALLKERHGDDKQKLSQEFMKLYKEEKINPLGGCLPVLIQMPIFLALYWALMESVQLRQAPFMGWIQDLSVMDPYFVLPILMGITMWIQQHLNPQPPDPLQAKIMKIFPIALTFLFLFFPAGLVLYWVTSNIISITQQWMITRRYA
ncbi:MAG: membrane protein insertase YidC [Pseudomonadota bacterium]